MKRSFEETLLLLMAATALAGNPVFAAEEAASQPAPQSPGGLVKTVELLERRLRDQDRRIAEQDRRIAELETRPVAASQAADGVTTEDVKRIVKEMAAEAAKNSSDFKITWNNGLWFRSGDGAFTGHLGGRLFADWGWVGGDRLAKDRPNFGQGSSGGKLLPLNLRDGEEFRNVRLWGEGTIYKYVQYKLEVDFAGNAVTLKDAYIRLTDVPVVGNVTVGNFKEPFSLDQLTSDSATTFMERSLADTLVPARNPGFMISNAFLGDKGSERMIYALGLFRQEAIGDTGVSDGMAVNSDGGYVLAGRVTGLPYYADKGDKLIHVGLAYSARGANDDANLRYRARPEAHFLPYRFLDTGNLAGVDGVQLLGAELAAVCGPFSLQSEFVSSLVDFDSKRSSASTSRNDVNFNAFYVQGSYFLTPGDRRNYNTGAGAFSPVVPKKNFRQDGGWGAVEVATRFSYLDLDERGLGGATRGELSDWTVGLNWYLNPNVRIMANYILAMPHRLDTESSVSIFMMRFQLDF